MVSRRLLLGATIGCLLLGVFGIGLYLQQRISRCNAVPLLAPELLPNADLSAMRSPTGLPDGWLSATSGVSVTNFTVLPGGHSLQLLGIANYVQTPDITAVRPSQLYCFTGQALTDSPAGSTTRLRVAFQWLDNAGTLVREDTSPWQPVVLWHEQQTSGWSVISAAFPAPSGATRLRVRLTPASDDRVYLDQMHVRAGGGALASDDVPTTVAPVSPVTALPWPAGRRAALSFSFDWETAMGGLVHSRSVDDPHIDIDYLTRAMRMRQGITNSLDIFRPYGVRATYYATGYNFLLGNTEHRLFMNNPTFTWANKNNRWLSDKWETRPWFADDPYSTVQADPDWYFGDLVPVLQREGQAIQTHTFSHLYGGFASSAQWQADFAAWKDVAAERGVTPARSLAFPWSGSGGMSDANWDLLEQNGIRSVTRLSDDERYRVVRDSDPHCRTVPGHERILACPDTYLTPGSVAQIPGIIDHTLQVSGTIDLWSHTEEVTTNEQIAAWKQAVAYAASKPDLWIAPLDEIASWQQAIDALRIDVARATPQNATATNEGAPLLFTVTNTSDHDLVGLALRVPFAPGKMMLQGQSATVRSASPHTLTLDVRAGQHVEVQLWPAS